MSEQDTRRIGEVYDRLVELERTQTESRQTAGERLQSYREYGGNAVAINLSEAIEPDAELKPEIAENYNLQPDTSSQTVRNGDSYNLDTREQLEADIAEYKRFHASDKLIDLMLVDVARCWLDRQAAITTAECTSEDKSCCEACRAAQKRKIAELTAERDELKAKLESYGKVPELGKRENSGERESYDAGFSNGVKAVDR